MAFKMAGYSYPGASPKKQGIWSKIKKGIKKQFTYDPEATYAGSKRSPADYRRERKSDPRYLAQLEKDRERYDAGKTLSEPRLAKKFKKEDEDKKASATIDKYTKEHLT